MEVRRIFQIIQNRRYTSNEWIESNRILLSGEFGYETDTGKLKIGDGTTLWNSLPYLQGSGGTGIDGEDGLSAYEIAVNNGFVGTEQEWLDSLVPFSYVDATIFSGDGETEATKFTIINGGIVETKLSTEVQTKLNSVGSGADGASAYEIAVSNGFVGTEVEWLASLEGDQGPQGIQGIQGEVGPQGAQGIQGETGLTGPEGPQGIQGIQGNPGLDGKTVLNGTVDPTTEGVDGDFYINTTSSSIFGPKTAGTWGSGTSLIGPQGEQGIQGIQGIQGETGAQGIQGIQGETGPEGPQGIAGEGITISERESNTVLFDQDYVIGNAGARTGNVVFDFTGAILGSSTIMIHTDASAFTIPGIVIKGAPSSTVPNYIYFLLIDSGVGTEKVNVTISQEIV